MLTQHTAKQTPEQSHTSQQRIHRHKRTTCPTCCCATFCLSSYHAPQKNKTKKQVIDVKSKRLQNVITFPPSGAFIVDSSIAVESSQRVSFKFTSAKLKTASRDWGVPPFGQGW